RVPIVWICHPPSVRNDSDIPWPRACGSAIFLRPMDFDRDFGVNQVFVEDQYERWRNNPAAVDEQWQRYFARMHGLPFPSAPAFQTSAWSQPPQPAAPVAEPRVESHFAGALLDIASPEIERLRTEVLQESVSELINAYRIRGHLFANLDPLGMLQPPPPEL